MKVAVYYSNSDIRIEDHPVPEIEPEEILVRVRASGICGSDVMEWYRKPKAPLVLGHEVAGEIVKVGKKVRKFKPGDRVVLSHHVPCNNCRLCRSGHHTVCETLRTTNFDPGGFSEYLRQPSINVDRGVFLLPQNVSFEEGVFVEPLACVLRAQRKAGVCAGKSVLVVGSGISGLLHIKVARGNLAGPIFASDISPFRLEFAKNCGADFTFRAEELSPDKIREKNDGYLADIVILCTGAKSAFYQAIECLELGGTLVVFATSNPDEEYPLNLNRLFWRTEKKIISSYGGSPAEYSLALHLIATGRVYVKDLITHLLPLEEIQKGFKLVEEGKESVKVIIRP